VALFLRTSSDQTTPAKSWYCHVRELSLHPFLPNWFSISHYQRYTHW